MLPFVEVVWLFMIVILIGALAMEDLHRQVLPFLMRRVKEDVLQDLPPKIIQDYHCELSPLQVKYTTDLLHHKNS